MVVGLTGGSRSSSVVLGNIFTSATFKGNLGPIVLVEKFHL